MMNRNSNIKISKSELIVTFSDIDVKINSLHQRSSSDFMQLNTYLKDYHKKTRIISENAYRILDTISGEREIVLIEELGKIHSRIEKYKERIKDEDCRKIQVLKEIILLSNQLNITLRNLRQDFTTFKFLSTNYCLISNYNDIDSDWNNKLETRNVEIQSIQKLLYSLTKIVDNLKEQILLSIGNVESRVEKSLNVFRNLSKETKSNIASVLLKSQESKLQFPLLKEKSANSSKSINDIITHLQYHDIIRQKIEHIQRSHYKIIDDLNKTIVTNKNEEESLSDDYLKISDIVDLQAAQLLLVSKEYQNALNVITNNFQGIANDVTSISGISDKFSYKDSNSEITLLKQIKDQLDEGIILLDTNNFYEVNSEYLTAGENLDLITNKIIDVLLPSLKNFTGLGNLVNINLKSNESESGIITQIISLVHDIELKDKELNEKINEIRSLSSNIFKPGIQDSWENELEIDRLQLMVNISKILDTLDKNNKELDDVLFQNRELNNSILERIENAINKGDYYDYFEETVEHVISQLNGINDRLKPVYSDDIMGNKAENLKDIKATYTMESERIIHENVVTGSSSTETNQIQDSESEIEFF
jgi:hypothetical protein